jgi:predicted enzyme related to lactoylglutathione lyase
MITGLRTAIYHTADLAAAKAWYTQVVGHGPYFDEPFYVGFAVGGFELGLMPDRPGGVGGTTVYWGTPDITAEAELLTGLGAKIRGQIEDVGSGIRVADFDDPFGNIFGVIENPHFKVADVR